MFTIKTDRTRVAILQLRDDAESTLEIDENDWPSQTHGSDTKAVKEWVKITGLTVTIKTIVQNTADSEGGQMCR
jgi:hypothetical protein